MEVLLRGDAVSINRGVASRETHPRVSPGNPRVDVNGNRISLTIKYYDQKALGKLIPKHGSNPLSDLSRHVAQLGAELFLDKMQRTLQPLYIRNSVQVAE